MHKSKVLAFQSLREICVPLSSIATSQITDLKLDQAQIYLNRLQNCLDQVVDLDYALAEYSFFPLSILLRHTPLLPDSLVQKVLRITTKLVQDGWRPQLDLDLFIQLLTLSNSILGRTLSQHPLTDHDDLIFDTLKCSLCLIESQRARAQDLYGGHASLIAFTLEGLVTVLSAGASDRTTSQALQCLAVYVNAFANSDFLLNSAPGLLSALHGLYQTRGGKPRTKNIYLEAIRISGDLLLDCYGQDCRSPMRSDPELLLARGPRNSPSPTTMESNLEIRVIVIKMLDFARTQDSAIICSVQEFCSKALHQAGSILFRLEKQLLLFLLDTVLLDVSPHLPGRRSDASWILKIAMASHHSIDAILNEELEIASSGGQAFSMTTLESLLTRVCGGYYLFAATVHQKHMLRLVEKALMIAWPLTVHGQPISPLSQLILDHSPVSIAKIRSNTVQYLPNTCELLFTKALTNTLDPVDFFQLCSKLTHHMQSCTEKSFFWSANYLSLLLRSWRDGHLNQGHETFVSRGSEDIKHFSKLIIALFQSSNSSDSELRSLYLLQVLHASLQVGMSLTRDEAMDVFYRLLMISSGSSVVLCEIGSKCLAKLAQSLHYSSAEDMVLENLDYLLNSISIELDTFDVTNELCSVLSKVISIGGASILSHLDDIKDSLLLFLAENHAKQGVSVPVLQVLSSILTTSKMVLIPGCRAPPVQTTSDTGCHHSKDPHACCESFTANLPAMSNGVVNLVSSILGNLPFLASSDEPETRYQAVKSMGDAFDCLAQNEDILLPLVHATWPVLLSRLQDKLIQIRITSAMSFSKLVTICGHFMRTRIDDDWNKIDDVFRQVTQEGRRDSPQAPPPLIVSQSTAFEELGKGILANVPLSSEIESRTRKIVFLLATGHS